MEKIKQLTSDNLVDNNIEALKQLFPTAFAEGKVVMEELQALLGDYVEKDKEYYEFNWAGKHLARQEANKVSTGTLRPCKEESKNWDDTQNLYIEGDNLEVLKLMQKTYSNKVKMIYIDPPYNTGKDFVYKDNYKDNLNNYLEISGQLDENGKKLSSNTEADGRYHSNWLNMMYPRLRLARNLLTEDGVIFISIGIHEVSNLTKICNEIFGEENFVEMFSWTKTSTPPSLAAKSRKTNEYILCYEKNINNIRYNGDALDGGDQPLLNTGNNISRLIFPKDTLYFKETSFDNGELNSFKSSRVSLVNDIVITDGFSNKDVELEGEFKWTQEFLNDEVEKGTTFIIKSKELSIRFIREGEGFKRPTNHFKDDVLSPNINKPENNVGTNENASSDLRQLMGSDVFSYPKPVSLIKYLINFICDKDDIILDFFSGSSTTAHAVMEVNHDLIEDNKKRLRIISVQLPENLNDMMMIAEPKEKVLLKNAILLLNKQGKPLNISELSKERIRRAGAKIAEEIATKIKELENKIEKLSKELPTEENKAEISKLKAEIQNLKNQDLGFRVFKLDSSNIKRWDTAPESLEQQLDMFDEAIKSDRTEEDILYEILLKYGLDLTTPIAEKVVDGCTIYNVGFGSLYVCLSENIQPMVAQAIAEWHKEFEDTNPNVIFSDSGFNGNDAAKTNAVQTLRQMGIENVRSI